MNSSPITTSQQSTETYSVSITAHGSTAAFIHLKLFNGFNELVTEGYEKLNNQVPRGLYLLKIELNQFSRELPIRVDKDIDQIIDTDESTNIVTPNGYPWTEYYIDAAKEWTKKQTAATPNTASGSLFLLVRFYGDRKKGSVTGNDLLILDKDRKEIFRMSGENVNQDPNGQWIVFNAALEPGNYFLVYRKGSKLVRERPLYLFAGWQTQYFLICHEKPLFWTARILILRNGSYVGDKHQENLEFDILLQKMHNSFYYVPPQIVLLTASAKWENPMLGIVAAYSYLLSTQHTDETLFSTILHNLETNILPGSLLPDLCALKILAANHFKTAMPQLSVGLPCLFLVGTKILIKQSEKQADLIQKGSLLEKIIPQMTSDTIWTNYAPPPIKRKTETNKSEPASTPKRREKSPKLRTTDARTETTTLSPAKLLNFPNSWVTSSLFSQLDSRTSSEKQLNVTDLASQFQVTRSVIEQHLGQLAKPEILSALAESIYPADPQEAQAAAQNVQSNLNSVKK